MPQKLNLMKEEMDFFHFFHEANGKPKAINSMYAPITENPPQPSKLKSEQEVQAREQLSVLESIQSMNSNRRREGTKKTAPSSERLTKTKKSTLRASFDAQVAQNSAIQAKNEGKQRMIANSTESMFLELDEEAIRYENGLQNGFVYFKGFAINKWIMIYLIRVGMSNTFIHNHLTALLDSAKTQGIPLGMPSKCYVFSLTDDGDKLAQETKERIVHVLTTRRKKCQLAMMYAPNNMDLEELTAAVKPVNNFRILTGFFTANYGFTEILQSLRLLVKEHKKIRVMGIATLIQDDQLMIARTVNNPETGARFDEPKLDDFQLTIIRDVKWNKHLVSIVRNYIRNKSLEKLVIFRSHESPNCHSMSYQNEVSDIQKLMEQSGVPFTYIVVKDIGPNQPIFEKLVDGIGFTDEEMTQLTAELSFHSQIKRIPAPLAMAHMSITMMVVHYDGFTQSENYKQVVRVKEGLDTKAYETVKKFLKCSLSDTKAQSKIKSKKKKTKASGEINADQMNNLNKGLDQKTNNVINDVEAIYAYSGANGYQPQLSSDQQGESRAVYVQKCADEEPNVKMKEDNGLKAGKEKDKQMTGLLEKRTAKESTSVVSSHAKNSAINVKNEDLEAIYKSGLQNGFVYFNGFAVNNWIMIYLVRVVLSNNFIHNHLTALLESAKIQGIPLGMPSKYYVFSLKSDGQKVAQETKEEIVHVLTTSSHKKVQMAMIIASNNIHLKELTAEITPMYNFRVIPGYFTAGYGLTKILKSLRLLVQEHKKIRVMGIATLIHDGQLMIARTVNNPKTGAQFDEPSVDGVKLRIVPDCQLNEQLVSIVWDYIKNRFLEKLVIYRSSNGRPVSEVSDIQKLMQQSGTRITYIVAKDIGPNRAIFEKVVDGIGFTDEEMTQLTAEISFHTQKTRIPAPLAVAKMSIARMVVHYDGFKHLGNYEQGAQVKEGLDTKAFKKVKKYLRSSLSDTTATTKIKSQKTKGQAKVSSKQIAFQSDAFMKMRQKGKKVK